MTTLAIFHPTHLVAGELRESLDRRRELWDRLHLLSVREDEIGTLTEVRGEAAVVAAVDESSFDGVDVAFFFGPPESYADLLGNLPEGLIVVLMGEDATRHDGLPIVADLNLAQAADAATLASPHPAAVAGALVLDRWLELKPARVSLTIMQPASVFGNEGLDELLEQTRSMLAFQSRDEEGALPPELAFNLYQHGSGVDGILDPLESLLEPRRKQPMELSAQVIQTSVFHGFGLAIQLAFDDDPGLDAVAQALEGSERFDLDVHPHRFGPKQAVAQDRIAVGRPQKIRPGLYSVWTAFDNLTLAGAGNAVAILEALVDRLALGKAAH